MLKGAIAELEKVRLAIVANARNFQSYPVAREAMTKLSATVTSRIIEHKTELERLSHEPTSTSA